MALSRVWLSILSVCLSSCLPTDSISPALPVVLRALGKVIQYYEKNYEELNLDGLFGLRVIEGQLELLSGDFEQGQFSHIPKDMVETINHYHVISSHVSRQGLEAARKDDPEYFNTMAYVVAYPWTFQNPHRKIDPSFKWETKVYKKSVKVELREQTSDSCMGELTGNSKLQKKGCEISEECIQIMSHKGLTQYGITHQLLWTMLGEKAGCTIELDEALSATSYHGLDGLRLELCTNNFYEMKELTDNYLNKTIIPKFQDLFLEQQFVCPNLGFGQFLSLEYLEAILSWQKSAGCFGKMPKVKHQVMKKDNSLIPLNLEYYKDYDYEDYTDIKEQNFKMKDTWEMEKKFNEKHLLDNGNDLKFHAHNRKENEAILEGNQNLKRRNILSLKEIVPPLFGQSQDYVVKGPRRKLLVEKEMFGGCLSHKTAVAAGALVMYLRYLIDPGETGLDKGSVKLVDPGKKRDILQKANRPVKDLDKIDPYQNDEGDDNEEDNVGYVDAGAAQLAGHNAEGGKELDKEIPDRDELYHEDKVVHTGGLNQDKDTDYDEDEDDDNNDEEYPYYDDNLDDKKLRSKHIRESSLHLKPDKSIKRSEDEGHDKTLKSMKSRNFTESNRTMILVFIGCFIVLFLFIFRFIKKRRIHIRYHTRALFGI